MNILSNLIVLDQSVGEGVIYWRNGFFDTLFYWLTKLGDWQIILFLSISSLLIFYFFKKKALIWSLMINMAGAGIMTIVIKYLVGRARPGINMAFYLEHGPSFPSAHATLILALFGFLIYCLWQSRLNRPVKIILTTLFSFTIILVGFSRIYLGVHFLSDIIGGYLVALFWLLPTIYFTYRRIV